MELATLLLASFTAPEPISTTPAQLFWFLPLAAAIAVAYKATKVPKITARNFARETILLFATLVVFMFLTGAVLCVLNWLITG